MKRTKKDKKKAGKKTKTQVGAMSIGAYGVGRSKPDEPTPWEPFGPWVIRRIGRKYVELMWK